MSMAVKIEELGWGIFKGPEGAELAFHYDDKDEEYIHSVETADAGNFKAGKAYVVVSKERDFYGSVCKVEVDFSREIDLDEARAECNKSEDTKTAMHIVIQHGADDVEMWSVDLPMSLFEEHATEGENLRGTVSDVMVALKAAIKAVGKRV